MNERKGGYHRPRQHRRPRAKTHTIMTMQGGSKRNMKQGTHSFLGSLVLVDLPKATGQSCRQE